MESPLLPWMIEDFRRFAGSETALWPDDEFVSRFWSYRPNFNSAPGQLYFHLYSLLADAKIETIVLCPWLKRGGADKGSLQFVEYYAKRGGVVLITTLDADSPWLEKVCKGVRTIEFGKLARDIAPDEQVAILTRLLLELAPRIVHNMNSDLGWRCFSRHGKALRSNGAKLVASLFGDEVDPIGRRFGYAVAYMPQVRDFLDLAVTDSGPYRETIRRRYHMPERRVRRVPFWHEGPPVTPSPESHEVSAEPAGVLWAGRLCESKRLDILVAVAETCADLQFHVFGSADETPSVAAWVRRLSDLPNVRLYGVYDGFHSIAERSRFRAFLYTTAFDGLPNVLLEAASHNLPIVAPWSIGGLADIVGPETAFPVDDPTDAGSYTYALRQCLEDPKEAKRRAQNAHELVRLGHSREAFSAAMDAALADLADAPSAPQQSIGFLYEPPSAIEQPIENRVLRRLGELRALALAEINATAPEVTVVIPCFNYGRFVTEAVESVLAQSYPRCRVVVVDDGSSDADTARICDGLASERVTVVHKTNQGLSAARNSGAAKTDAPYLMFLDADDRLHPDAVLFMLHNLISHPHASYVYCSQRFFGDDNLVWEPQVFNGYDLLFANHPSVCSLIRRSAYAATRGYSPGMVVGYEDWGHWLMLLASGRKGQRLRAPLFEHRRHGHTMTHDAHARRKLLHRKLRQHAPSLYTLEALSAAKAEWRPAVSIAMPCYNNQAYLDETIAAVRAQTTYDFELILVDDGSTDPAAIAKLKEIEAIKDSFGFPTLVLWEPHRGLPGARNAAVARARGEYVYMLDSDDLIAPTAIEKLVLFAQIHPEPSYVYSAVRHFGAIEGICRDSFDAERLKRENFLTGTSLLPRALYESIGGLDEALVDSYEDYDLWLRLLAAGHHGMLLDETLFSYRRHDRGNLTALSKRKSHEEMLETLRARHPRLYGGPEPDRSHWKLFEREYGADALQSETETILTSVFADERGLRRDSHRRKITPDMFSPRVWRRARPNVLYLLPFFVCGGAEQVDLDIIAGMTKRGFNVTIVSSVFENNVWINRFEALCEDIFVFPNFTTDPSLQDSLLDYLTIARAIDVVFIRNSAIGYRMSERWRAVTSQVSFVDLMHLHANGLAWDWAPFAAIYHDCLDKRIVITQDLKTYACNAYHLAADRFQVIYNGLDFDALPAPAGHPSAKRRVCEEFGLDADKPLVGFCGRLAEQKDPLRWLEVFALAARDNPDLRGLMIGEGELEEQTKARACQLGVADAIVFAGYRSDARQIIAGFDVLLLTSRFEGLPTVILEGLAAGVPAVASDVGGTRECFGGSISRLLPLSAPNGEYAAAINAVLAELATTPDAREACRARIREPFDIERMQDTYCKAIEDLAAGLDRKARLDDYLDHLMDRAVLG